jgi:hypothetical protein
LGFKIYKFTKKSFSLFLEVVNRKMSQINEELMEIKENNEKIIKEPKDDVDSIQIKVEPKKEEIEYNSFEGSEENINPLNTETKTNEKRNMKIVREIKKKKEIPKENRVKGILQT